MKRWQALDRLDAAWTDFEESYAGLSDSRLMIPGVTGQWSVRDIIAHVTWWEEEALKHLPLVLAGGQPPRCFVTHGGIDAFYPNKNQHRKPRSLTQGPPPHDAGHRRLLALVQGAPQERLSGDTPLR